MGCRRGLEECKEGGKGGTGLGMAFVPGIGRVMVMGVRLGN